MPMCFPIILKGWGDAEVIVAVPAGPLGKRRMESLGRAMQRRHMELSTILQEVIDEAIDWVDCQSPDLSEDAAMEAAVAASMQLTPEEAAWLGAKDSTATPLACEVCHMAHKGEEFPFAFCSICGACPSGHHGRCCRWRTGGPEPEHRRAARQALLSLGVAATELSTSASSPASEARGIPEGAGASTRRVLSSMPPIESDDEGVGLELEETPWTLNIGKPNEQVFQSHEDPEEEKP